MALGEIEGLVDDRPRDGVFRVHRDVFADPALFEQELAFIFERTWNFLTIDSQLARPFDFVTCFIGRTPVLVMRDGQGTVGAFRNVCRHKGALICSAEQGNAKRHVCPYHGWTYDAAGRNVDIKDRRAGSYTPAFEADDHNLLPLARIANYKGLIFGSLSPDVPPLEEFLGDMRFFIDLAMEQGPHGMEFVPGRTAYTYRANWKLQMDNGVDPYHLTSTHISFINIQGRRRRGEGHVEARELDWAKRAAARGGAFTFPYGHSVMWSDQPEPEKRPFYPVLDEIRARVGDLRASWMLKVRNAEIFPNMQIGESQSLMLRTFRPLAVDRTEMRSYCLAPIGEPRELRARRLRQFEDFFNPTGLATPDDTITYEECQRGLVAQGLGWLQGCARGMATMVEGPDDVAQSLGIRPASSALGSFESGPETCFHAAYREWSRLMAAGAAGRKAYT
jgi:phenylpropionate dioxygenase-like ring-hydroxylating dioxygenase large terminal subunit